MAMSPIAPYQLALRASLLRTGSDAGDRLGYRLAGAGDLNGDGYADIILGAPGADGANNGLLSAGEASVIFGGPGLGAAVPGQGGVLLVGTSAGGAVGSSVAGVGDLNGDGRADIAVGQPSGRGRVHLLTLGSDGTAPVLGGPGDSQAIGYDMGGMLGYAVAGAGDVNGDGLDDLVMGDLGIGRTADYRGDQVILFGARGTNIAVPPLLLVAAGVNGFSLRVSDAGLRVGAAVAGAGDLNGDGFDDIAFGAPYMGGGAGGVFVVQGGVRPPSRTTSDLAAGTGGFVVRGAAPGDLAGTAVAAAGDVDGDGLADLLIGAPGAAGGAGAVYVLRGQAGGFAASVDLGAVAAGQGGFVIRGFDPQEAIGTSVAGGGDINGDGIDDIVIGTGAPNAAGLREAYVIFGRASGFAGGIDLGTVRAGIGGFVIQGEPRAGGGGLTVAMAGDVNGDGFADVLVSDPGALDEAGAAWLLAGGDLSGAVTRAGTAGADLLEGDAGANVIVGGDGNDVMRGHGGADVLLGGAGDDVLVVDDTGFARIDGGTGTDTLVLNAAGVTLDLTAIPDLRLRGIERIDLTGTGANTLVLTPGEVSRLSPTTNQLLVDGNADDSVVLSLGSWSMDGVVGDRLVYSSGNAQVLVRPGMALRIGPATPGMPQLRPADDDGLYPSDAVTSHRVVTLLGTGTAGTLVELYDSTTLVGVGTVDAGGHWAIQTSTLSDGDHAIAARARDIQGMASPFSGPLTVTVDTTPPVQAPPALVIGDDTGRSAQDNITMRQSVSLCGVTESLARIVLRDGATVLAQGQASRGGAWVVATGPLADGTHMITAEVTDLAGNVGTSAPMTLVIDTVAPALSTVPDLLAASDTGSLATDNITGDTSPVFTGTAEAGAIITLLDGEQVVGQGRADATGAWALATSTLAAGLHRISAQVSDVAGNAGPTTAALDVTIVTCAAPGQPALAAASDTGRFNGDAITSTRAVTLQGAAAPGTRLAIYDGSLRLGIVTADAAGAWSLRTPSLTEGLHGITARVIGTAGVEGTPSDPLALVIDTTAPAVGTPNLAAWSDTGSLDSDNITDVTLPCLTGSAEAGSLVTLFDAGVAIGSDWAGTEGNWAIIPTTPLAAGAHTLTVRATDLAGNVSGASAALRLTVQGPLAVPGRPDLAASSDTGVSDSDDVTRIRTPVVQGSAAAGARVTIFDGATQVGTAIADATGAWSARLSTLADGVHALTAVATAAGGFQSAASEVLLMTVDATAPAVAGRPSLAAGSDTGSSATDNVTALASVVLTGTAEAGAIVTLLDGATVIGTAVAGADGSWSTSTTALADGIHTIRARAGDIAGNTAAQSVSLTVTVDTAVPAAPVVTSWSTAAISGTAEAGAVVTLRDGARVLGSATAGTSGAWTVSGSFAGQRFDAFTAIAADRAGNTAGTAPQRVVFGTAGADLMTDGGTPAILVGGGGDDRYLEIDPRSVVVEAPNQGSDMIRATSGYTLAAGAEIEFLYAPLSGAPSVLTGNEFANTIVGGGSGDTITGGGGRDTLYGGAGPDVFVFTQLSDSSPDLSLSDVIEDFRQAEGDRLDVSAIDANVFAPGDQVFTFIGAAGFSGRAGELQVSVAGGMTVVQGDVNGDRVADFAVQLRGLVTLNAGDLRL